uniref:Uncharacterized protein n=1 Tax=Ciona intestinalis TaxID=7719 RepID=H2XR67_CIOIN
MLMNCHCFNTKHRVIQMHCWYTERLQVHRDYFDLGSFYFFKPVCLFIYIFYISLICTFCF